MQATCSTAVKPLFRARHRPTKARTCAENRTTFHLNRSRVVLSIFLLLDPLSWSNINKPDEPINWVEDVNTNSIWKLDGSNQTLLATQVRVGSGIQVIGYEIHGINLVPDEIWVYPVGPNQRQVQISNGPSGIQVIGCPFSSLLAACG